MSGDVLDAIDGALRDYDLSADAMRWAPEPVICDGGRPLQVYSPQSPPSPIQPAVITVDGETIVSFTALETGRQPRQLRRGPAEGTGPGGGGAAAGEVRAGPGSA